MSLEYVSSLAILNSNMPIFRGLVEDKVIILNVVDPDGNSLLWGVTSTEKMSMLLNTGINLDIQNNDGNTWLHYRYSGTVEIFLNICERSKTIKFNPNLKNKVGKSILDTWTDKSCIERFRKLIHCFTEPLALNDKELLEVNKKRIAELLALHVMQESKQEELMAENVKLRQKVQTLQRRLSRKTKSK